MRLVTVSMVSALLAACGGPAVGPEAALRPWIADAYQFAPGLAKDDDEWKFIGARWGEVGQELH